MIAGEATSAKIMMTIDGITYRRRYNKQRLAVSRIIREAFSLFDCRQNFLAALKAATTLAASMVSAMAIDVFRHTGGLAKIFSA